MTDLYAVIGNPIEHSKSPQIHAAFARQTGQDMRYERILGDLEEFEADVEAFIAGGGCGLNVTVPFKERAFRLADALSGRARDAGAVSEAIVGILENPPPTDKRARLREQLDPDRIWDLHVQVNARAYENEKPLNQPWMEV